MVTVPPFLSVCGTQRSGPDGSIALHAPQPTIITTHYFNHKIKSWRITGKTDPKAIVKPGAAQKTIVTDSKPSDNAEICILFIISRNNLRGVEIQQIESLMSMI